MLSKKKKHCFFPSNTIFRKILYILLLNLLIKTYINYKLLYILLFYEDIYIWILFGSTIFYANNIMNKAKIWVNSISNFLLELLFYYSIFWIFFDFNFCFIIQFFEYFLYLISFTLLLRKKVYGHFLCFWCHFRWYKLPFNRCRWLFSFLFQILKTKRFPACGSFCWKSLLPNFAVSMPCLSKVKGIQIWTII